MNLSSAWSKYILRLLVQQGPIPKHVGFIMDGNRRYGKEHKMSLEKAYQTGAQTLETVSINPICSIGYTRFTELSYRYSSSASQPESRP